MTYPAIRPTTIYVPSSPRRFALSTALDGALAREVLTPEERWVSGCLPASERCGYRAGRLAARRALFGMERDPRAPTPLREPTVAIAHSGGRAVAAATVGPARLGIALERGRGVLASEGRLFSGPAEAGLAVDDPAVVRALKEASWDALGLPGEVALDELELRFSESGRMLGLHFDGIGVRAVGAVALPWAGWIAAVVSMEGVS